MPPGAVPGIASGPVPGETGAVTSGPPPGGTPDGTPGGTPNGTPGVAPGAWRRFFCLAAGTAAAIIGVLFVFVTLADPWDSLPLSPPLPRAPVTASQRFAYPALARSPRFDSAVFGTSTSRLLRPSALNQSFHARFANLAMNDATPWEQTQLMRVFLRAHPTASRLILGLDVKWCQTGETIPRLTPRPFPDWLYADSLWRGHREMLNLYAIQEAGKQFGVLTGLKREEQGRDGYTVFVPPDDRYDRDRAQAHLREDGVTMPPGSRSGPPEEWLFPAFDDLRALLETLPADSETVLFFVPYHRVRLAPPGHPAAPVWAECKQRAVSLAHDLGRVLVVDFMKPGPITDDDDGYWDAQHYRVSVADRVARDLAEASRGEESPDYDILFLPGR